METAVLLRDVYFVGRGRNGVITTSVPSVPSSRLGAECG
jgi:hypothetical protein